MTALTDTEYSPISQLALAGGHGHHHTAIHTDRAGWSRMHRRARLLVIDEERHKPVPALAGQGGRADQRAIQRTRQPEPHQPNLGSFTRAWRRFSFCTTILLTCGRRNEGRHRRAERHRTRNVPCVRHALSRSINVCCSQ